MVPIVFLAGSGIAQAAPVTDFTYFYEFAPGGGVPAYSDPLNSKLMDGSTGSTDFGDGSWVGIFNAGQSGAGVIVFNFAASVTITDVAMNFLRNDGGTIEVTPGVSIFENSAGEPNNQGDFAPVDFTTDDTEGYFHFAGSWTGTQLIVSVGQNNITVPFLNEVQFNPTDSNPVDPGGAAPEPGSAGLAVVGLLSAFAIGRTRGYLRRRRIARGIC